MKINHLFLITTVCLALVIPEEYRSNAHFVDAEDLSTPHSITLSPQVEGWSEPGVIYQEAWDDPLFSSFNDSNTRLVALIPDSGSDDNSRHIVVSEYNSGAWQTPVVIAQNGSYSYALYQVLPQQTHPVISGDGSTIAYVGYTGTTFGAYIVNRLSGGDWDTPQLLPTGLENTHYWISLSYDGNTLALCDYPFFGIQQVYVLTRTADVWSAPHLIGAGGNPSLSRDGKKITFVYNARVAFAEQISGTWTAPVELTDNANDEFSAEFPQMSGDGWAIHYWLVTLVPKDSAYIRTAQDLFIIRREDSGWSAPQKVNPTPIEPVFRTEGPAAADYYATRLIYSRPITTTNPIDDSTVVEESELEISEWLTDTWQATTLVESTGFNNFNTWPHLSPNGKTLVFDGGVRYNDNVPTYNALWKMTTDVAPQFPFWVYSISTVIGPGGGSLFSAFDNITYLFGSGTFTDTVEFTHSYWPDPPPAPSGMTGFCGIGGIGGNVGDTAGPICGTFSATMFGPGGLPMQPTSPVTVTVNYSNTNTGPTIPGTLGLFRWNLDEWDPLTFWDDPINKKVTGTMTHFSNFAVFGETYQSYLPIVVR